jgi:hypothetical protein
VILSNDSFLVYILADSGVKGRLASGRIERGPGGTLDVFDARGDKFEYLSGERIRSWRVAGSDGKPAYGWHKILPEDRAKFDA